MLVMRTPEGRTDAIGQFLGAKQALGLHYYCALAVHPLGLYRIEPRASLRQQAADDPHPSPALLDLPIVPPDPPAHLVAYVPAGVLPHQTPNLLARRQLLRTPREELGVVVSLTGRPSTKRNHVSSNSGKNSP